ncbi:MAG TPA: serine/threonine-protein kinase, partial [Pirellulales bacterium]
SGSLADHLANSPPSQQQAIRWVIEIADALEYAHLHGVIHRDIKSANILIDHHNRALLADFGIAQSANKAGRQALSLGTLRYMSPEQLEGREVDPRADIFSLGVVLHEALTGKLPYSSVEPNVLRREIVAGITDVSAAGLPAELRRICKQALDRDPQRRHTSAAHLAADLRRYLDNKPRSSWWPWVLACVLLAVVGITSRIWQHRQRAGQVAGGELGEDVKQVSKPPPKAVDSTRGGRQKDEAESPAPPVAQSAAGVRQSVMDAVSETRKMVGRIDAKAAIDVGHSYLREKKTALAIQEFRRAVRVDPTNSDGWHGLGVALFNDGQYDEAVSALSNAIKFDPANLDARMHRGLAYNIQEDFDNAINDLADAIAKSPADKRKYRETLAAIYSHRAAVRSDAQDFAAAAEDMDRAITLFPDGENFYHQRASCLFNAQQFERAVADFAEAIRREPNKADHYRHRGMCWQALGDEEKAAADFEKAQSIEGKQP